MSTRKRSHVNYIDKSDDDNYVEIKCLTDIKETSSWSADIVRSLNILIENTKSINELFGNNVSLDSYTESLVIPEWDTNIDICQLTNNNKIKTLFNKAKEVKLTSNIEEMYIDGFINSLLSITGFDDYPCKLYPQYSYRAFFVNEHYIGSKADFAVLSNTNKILLVIEDKTTSNATYANDWKEPQVIGEIFVALHKIIASTDKEISLPIILYAIRVVGTRFTFYKCSANADYIKESAFKLPKKSHMIVYRFPTTYSNRLVALDFCNKVDRNTLLKCLSSIRQELISR